MAMLNYIPTTENQLNKYYHFRWQMLREPWRMPVVQSDEYDPMSHHRMIVDGRGRPMAIGRLYITPDLVKVRSGYMAVKNSRRSKGMGSLIRMFESLARQEGAALGVYAREDAISFYEKNDFERRWD